MQLLALQVDAVGVDAFGGHPVFCDNRCVGIITSGAYGARVGQSLALAYLREPLASLGGHLTVELLGESVTARVLSEPPFDPDNHRLRNS